MMHKIQQMSSLIMLSFTRFFLQWVVSQSLDASDFLCSDDFCLDYEVTYRCPVADIEKCYNESLAILLPSPTVCSCCETCLIYQNLGDSCILGLPGQVLPDQMCGPGLKCVKAKCVEMDENEQDSLTEDANYECFNNQCNCVVKAENLTIFGSFPEKHLTNGERQCECSILAYKAQTQLIRSLPFDDIYQPFARCLPTGQFDPLQCSEGICRCVEPGTGVYDETIRPVSDTSLGHRSPICYDEINYNHTKTYYRPCENGLKALLRARDFAEAEGFEFMFPFTFKCRPDGNFKDEVTDEIRAAVHKLTLSPSARFTRLAYENFDF